MPLPPALLKRLANRGIVQGGTAKGGKLHVETEEIIAEDYDEVEDPSQYDVEPVKKPAESFWIERMKRRIGETNASGYKCCPNKYNTFHKCTLFCINRWGDGVLEPRRTYLKRRNRLLRKYPLPKNWMEIYDYGCGVHYYWNTTNETVSWLPPGHPKSNVSKSAAALRRELDEILPPEMDENDDGAEQMSLDIQKILDEPMPPPPIRRQQAAANPPPTSFEFLMSPPPMLKKPKSRDLDKALRLKRARKSSALLRTKVADNPLDPMDPAAYSNIPRGKWSDGLTAGETSAKTGVDSTASGTLYQMRPYPSPGAVLQANSSAKKLSKASTDCD